MRRFFLPITAIFGLAAGPTQAAGLYDPALQWSTITTPQFRVHYPDDTRALAIRVGRMAEAESDALARLFAFKLEGMVDIVLSDNSDFANGSAQVLPRNTIRLFLSAPTELTGLSSYEDWLRILVIHELAHLYDIDQAHGFTRGLRWLFGKTIQWNGFAPQFLSEGVAVYAETLLTPTGRGRSSFVQMILRCAALEDRWLPIDQANVVFSDWPGPNAAYYYGGRFHLWLAATYGSDRVAALHRANASFVLPYLYWPTAQGVFGKSLPQLWQEWRIEETAAAQQLADRLRQQGLTNSRRITHHGRNITGSRYSKDGSSILYSRVSPVDGATVRVVPLGRGDAHSSAEGDRTLIKQTFSRRFGLSRDGGSFYYAQNAINERFNNFSDLYRYTFAAGDGDLLGDGTSEKLVDHATPDLSLRARDPDVSPDGRTLVFVQNRMHQSWLSLGQIDEDDNTRLHVRVLVPPQGDRQQASPRFSPDGAHIAVSTWFVGGHRDIVIIDANTGVLEQRISNDAALDGNPAWSPDGRHLLFESDRDGIFNIYAYDRQEQVTRRVTRVLGGAFQADVSQDGRFVAFRNASAHGFDIHEMPFNPQDWPVVADAGAEVDMQASAGLRPERAQRHEDPPWLMRRDRVSESLSLELPEGMQDGAYSPWSSVLPFNHNWNLFPAVFLGNAQDPTMLATYRAFDALAEHTASATVGTSLLTRRPLWSVAYLNDIWYPTFALGYADLTTAYRATDAIVLQRRRGASFSIGLPLKQRHRLALSYSFADTISGAPVLNLGRSGALELGYGYNFTRNYAYSVSPEDGMALSLALRWYSSSLGGDFNELLAVIDARHYLNNPLWDNHVLALRLVAAFAAGPDYREVFNLGGHQGDSLFTVQANSVFPLRGFALDVDLYRPGTGLLAFYAEYRLPLWHIERGLWTLPFFVERLHGALYFDGGNTFGDGSDTGLPSVSRSAWRALSRARGSVGAEVRVDLSLGWAFPLTSRIGIAWPLLNRGALRRTAPLPYWAVGSSL